MKPRKVKTDKPVVVRRGGQLRVGDFIVAGREVSSPAAFSRDFRPWGVYVVAGQGEKLGQEHMPAGDWRLTNPHWEFQVQLGEPEVNAWGEVAP